MLSSLREICTLITYYIPIGINLSITTITLEYIETIIQNFPTDVKIRNHGFQHKSHHGVSS